MNTASRQAGNRADQLPPDILQLIAAVEQLPAEQRKTVDTALLRVRESTERRRRILNLVQEALGQLRLDMKYLVFDLEATRRERDEYRRQLEDV